LPPPEPGAGDPNADQGGGGGGGGPPGSPPANPPTNPPPNPPPKPPDQNQPVPPDENFEFPDEATFPQEYVGQWGVYSLLGEGNARHITLVFGEDGSYNLITELVGEQSIPPGASTTSTPFNAGIESLDNLNLIGYWWEMAYEEEGTLYFYYTDYDVISSDTSRIEGDSLYIGEIEFKKS
jgi:hypothetical protein